MADNLESVIEREFQEVRKTREDLLAKRAEIDEQLSALDLRLKAAENYKATLEGKFKTPAPSAQTRAPRAPSTRRGSRTELRERIRDILRSHPDGLPADRINAELGATDTKQKQQVANLLSVMKKEDVLQQEARRGPYTLTE